MSQEQEYQNLARRFADLWQERMTAMMHDGEFVRMLLKMVQSTPGTANSQGFSPYASPFTAPPAGGPAHAPDTRDDAMARLERSLAGIERRLAGLEEGKRSAPKRKRAAKTVAKTARRPKTGKSGRGRVKK